MEQAKHVALEVPAALTLEDCWRLVHTAERTQRHCFLLENCCYDPFHLEMLARVEAGDFGELKHAEGAYIHNLQGQDPADLPEAISFTTGWGSAIPLQGATPILPMDSGLWRSCWVSIEGIASRASTLVPRLQGSP